MGDSWALTIFEKLLEGSSGAVLDVGANVGQTLLKVKSCSPERAWIGFEPNSTCVMYLERLIAANQFRHCTLIPAGLFAETGVMGLDCFHEDPADKTASLVENFRTNQTVVRRKWVPVLQYEALIRAGIDQRVALVKIDVEGGEKEVLGSLHELLKRDRPAILLEILPVYKPENRERLIRQQAVEEQFRVLNYTMCRVEKSPDDRLVGLKPLKEVGVHDDITWSDYLVIPTERLESVLASFGFGAPVGR